MKVTDKKYQNAIKKLLECLPDEIERKEAKKAITKAISDSINRGYGGHMDCTGHSRVGNWCAEADYWGPRIKLYYFIGEVKGKN